jgi:hypothetical protein
MEIIEVISKLDPQGKLLPIRFTWKGVSYPVDSIGRQWEDDRGQHILVMIPGGRTFELLYASRDQVWLLIPISSGPVMA